MNPLADDVEFEMTLANHAQEMRQTSRDRLKRWHIHRVLSECLSNTRSHHLSPFRTPAIFGVTRSGLPCIDPAA